MTSFTQPIVCGDLPTNSLLLLHVLGTESILNMALKYSMGRRGVLWGTTFVRSTKLFSSASMLCMYLFMAFSWVREVIRLVRSTWQHYASSNITAVHSKASHAESCNTTPLKRGSCTKWTQRLPGCKFCLHPFSMSLVSHCTQFR